MGTLFTEDVLLGLSGSTTRNSREGEILEERLYFFLPIKNMDQTK